MGLGIWADVIPQGMRLEGPVVEPEVLGNREHLDISTGLEDSWALASVVPAGLVT
jgi:hypothetical protein